MNPLSKTTRLIAGATVVVVAVGIMGAAAYAAFLQNDYERLYSWGDVVLGFLLAKVFILADPEVKNDIHT